MIFFKASEYLAKGHVKTEDLIDSKVTGIYQPMGLMKWEFSWTFFRCVFVDL